MKNDPLRFDLRDQLVELGNERAGDQCLFGGTATGSSPWVEVEDGVQFVSSDDIEAGLSQTDLLKLEKSLATPATSCGHSASRCSDPTTT